MTTHASNELVWAMRGECPARDAVTERPARSARLPCCGKDRIVPTPALASESWPASHEGAHEHRHDPIDCPACIVILFKASDPVRWDYLLERGLLDKFVKVT